MSRYIDKFALQDKLQKKKPGIANKRYTEGWNDAVLMVKSMVHSAPTADVAPVVHARWNADGRCTNCGGHAPYYRQNGAEGIGMAEYYESPYCFGCGAKMDG